MNSSNFRSKTPHPWIFRISGIAVLIFFVMGLTGCEAISAKLKEWRDALRGKASEVGEETSKRIDEVKDQIGETKTSVINKVNDVRDAAREVKEATKEVNEAIDALKKVTE